MTRCWLVGARTAALAGLVLWVSACTPESSSSSDTEDLWNERDATNHERSDAEPHTFRSWSVDMKKLRRALGRAPLEGSGEPIELTLPIPDGSFVRVAVQESPILGEKLQAMLPDIRTYRAWGVDDPSIHGRLDLTPLGFHGMLRTDQGTAYVDPRKGHYINYWGRHHVNGGVGGASLLPPIAASTTTISTTPPTARIRRATTCAPIASRSRRLASTRSSTVG